jgi:hypothetical protein
LQREADIYSNQFVLFLAAQDTPGLYQCLNSPSFTALNSAMSLISVAPNVIKKFRVVPPGFAVNIPVIYGQLTTPNATFTVTHLDTIPSIAGNIDQAINQLGLEVRNVTSMQQQGNGVIFFFGMQATDRSNHFTLVQVHAFFYMP